MTGGQVTGADDGSFEAFVAERSATLLRTAYLLTGDRVQARDLLQTALLATGRHWDQLADLDRATAFARRQLVAVHTGWRRLLRVGDLLAGSPPAGAAGLLEFAQRPTDPGPQDDVSRALAGLAPGLRAALVLRYGDGLSETAAAELLGRPVDVVATDTARGLELLGTDGTQLGRSLAQRAQAISTDPGDAVASAREGARTQRLHRLALGLLAAVLVAIVLLVVVTL
jgi:DNA-directed RNA polymerase specialized sigma24 family protein